MTIHIPSLCATYVSITRLGTGTIMPLSRYQRLLCHVPILNPKLDSEGIPTFVAPHVVPQIYFSSDNSFFTRELPIDCNLDQGSRLRASRVNINFLEVQHELHMLSTVLLAALHALRSDQQFFRCTYRC